jgi:hypothetical protein
MFFASNSIPIVRLEQNSLPLANALSYYPGTKITAVKNFIVKAPPLLDTRRKMNLMDKSTIYLKNKIKKKL